MPTALASDYRVATRLLAVQGASAGVRALKRQAVRGLSATRTWGQIVGDALVVQAVDTRPRSMLRRVDFDDSPDPRGAAVAFVEAPEDDSDFSW